MSILHIKPRHYTSRPVVPGCAGCAMAHPDFGRSVNPISTRGDRLCPSNYYWHPRIFRPSNGPVKGTNRPSKLSFFRTGPAISYKPVLTDQD